MRRRTTFVSKVRVESTGHASLIYLSMPQMVADTDARLATEDINSQTTQNAKVCIIYYHRLCNTVTFTPLLCLRSDTVIVGHINRSCYLLTYLLTYP